MPLTRKRLSEFEWKLQFEADGIKVFGAKQDENVSVIHQKRNGSKTKIIYNVFGHRTDSPTEAVWLYNREEKDRRRGRSIAAGSPESIASRKGAMPGR